MKKYEIDFQLAPPHIHRRNAADRAIVTYKNHFMSGLLTTDPDLQISKWDRLPSQHTITLNLLEITGRTELSQYMPTFLVHTILINLLWHQLEPA